MRQTWLISSVPSVMVGALLLTSSAHSSPRVERERHELELALDEQGSISEPSDAESNSATAELLRRSRRNDETSPGVEQGLASKALLLRLASEGSIGGRSQDDLSATLKLIGVGVDSISTFDFDMLTEVQVHAVESLLSQHDSKKHVGGEPAVLPRPIAWSGGAGTMGGAGTIGIIHPGTGGVVTIDCSIEAYLDLDGSCVGTAKDQDGKAIDVAALLDELRAEWNGYVRIPPGKADVDTCSGVLIAPDRVVTAAHCAEAAVSRGIQIGATEREWKDRANHYTVDVCAAHCDATKGKNPGNTRGSCTIGRTVRINYAHDLAVLHLHKEVPSYRAQPRKLLTGERLREFEGAPTTTTLSMFGYGYTKIRGDNKIKCSVLTSNDVDTPTTRQQMDAKLVGDAQEQPLKIEVDVRALAQKIGPSPIYGAVCGDSGGPLVLPAAEGRRELVIGIIVKGNDEEDKSAAASVIDSGNHNFVTAEWSELESSERCNND